MFQSQKDKSRRWKKPKVTHNFDTTLSTFLPFFLPYYAWYISYFVWLSYWFFMSWASIWTLWFNSSNVMSVFTYPAFITRIDCAVGSRKNTLLLHWSATKFVPEYNANYEILKWVHQKTFFLRKEEFFNRVVEGFLSKIDDTNYKTNFK